MQVKICTRCNGVIVLSRNEDRSIKEAAVCRCHRTYAAVVIGVPLVMVIGGAWLLAVLP